MCSSIIYPAGHSFPLTGVSPALPTLYTMFDELSKIQNFCSVNYIKIVLSTIVFHDNVSSLIVFTYFKIVNDKRKTSFL